MPNTKNRFKDISAYNSERVSSTSPSLNARLHSVSIHGVDMSLEEICNKIFCRWGYKYFLEFFLYLARSRIADLAVNLASVCNLMGSRLNRISPKDVSVFSRRKVPRSYKVSIQIKKRTPDVSHKINRTMRIHIRRRVSCSFRLSDLPKTRKTRWFSRLCSRTGIDEMLQIVLIDQRNRCMATNIIAIFEDETSKFVSLDDNQDMVDGILTCKSRANRNKSKVVGAFLVGENHVKGIRRLLSDGLGTGVSDEFQIKGSPASQTESESKTHPQILNNLFDRIRFFCV